MHIFAFFVFSQIWTLGKINIDDSPDRERKCFEIYHRDGCQRAWGQSCLDRHQLFSLTTHVSGWRQCVWRRSKVGANIGAEHNTWRRRAQLRFHSRLHRPRDRAPKWFRLRVGWGISFFSDYIYQKNTTFADFGQEVCVCVCVDKVNIGETSRACLLNGDDGVIRISDQGRVEKVWNKIWRSKSILLVDQKRRKRAKRFSCRDVPCRAMRLYKACVCWPLTRQTTD